MENLLCAPRQTGHPGAPGGTSPRLPPQRLDDLDQIAAPEIVVLQQVVGDLLRDEVVAFETLPDRVVDLLGPAAPLILHAREVCGLRREHL